jgi:hypothetical protein
MALILTRSPYFVSREDLDDNAVVTLEIGYYDIDLGGLNTQKTYTLNFRSSYLMDISPLLRDYLGNNYEYSAFSGSYIDTISGDIVSVRVTLSGEKNGVAQSDVVTSYFVTDGYLYSTDEYNEDFSSKLKENCYYTGSTDLVYKLDDSDLSLSFLATDVDIFTSNSTETVTINYKKDGEVVKSDSVSFDYDYTSFSRRKVYSSNTVSYLQRVELDSGVLESNNCLDNFFDEFKTQDYDEVMLVLGNNIKVIKVKTIEECKYKPYRVTFLNRYGLDEDLWFFKRSDTSISINKEMFRGNSVGMYNAGDGVKTMQHFNVNGYEKITLNSGFVEEEMNEAFRQLLLSEEVTLYDYRENKEYNVNIATSELQYKQHVNDKLINYTIEFEFAHEVINNVG